jgi:hypothetical protein
LARLEENVASIMALDYSELRRDVKCLKREVRLLKMASVARVHSAGEEPRPDEPGAPLVLRSSAVAYSEGVADRLEEKVDALSAAFGNLSVDDVRHDVKCLKYELKQLLSVRPGHSPRSPGLENLIGVLTETVKKDLRGELKGIRGELKRLAASAEASGPLAGADQALVAQPAALSREIDIVKREIEELRGQFGGADRRPAVAQVFVDLPQAAAVQLVFRADHPPSEVHRDE